MAPLAISVVGVDPGGILLRMRLSVHNPNDFALHAESVSGDLFLGEPPRRLGQGQARPGQAIAAGGSAQVSTQLRVVWQDLPSMTSLLGRAQIPYSFVGNARLGGGSFHLSLPFELRGSITSQQLLQATVRGLPPLLQ